jgi:hypothetical protein
LRFHPYKGCALSAEHLLTDVSQRAADAGISDLLPVNVGKQKDSTNTGRCCDSAPALNRRVHPTLFVSDIAGRARSSRCRCAHHIDLMWKKSRLPLSQSNETECAGMALLWYPEHLCLMFLAATFGHWFI